MGFGTQEVHVPYVKQAHEYGHVLFKGRGAEVLVHGVEAREEFLENLRSKDDGQRGADCRVYGVATAYPVPEAEGIFGVNAEGSNLIECG